MPTDDKRKKPAPAIPSMAAAKADPFGYKTNEAVLTNPPQPAAGPAVPSSPAPNYSPTPPASIPKGQEQWWANQQKTGADWMRESAALNRADKLGLTDRQMAGMNLPGRTMQNDAQMRRDVHNDYLTRQAQNAQAAVNQTQAAYAPQMAQAQLEGMGAKKSLLQMQADKINQALGNQPATPTVAPWKADASGRPILPEGAQMSPEDWDRYIKLHSMLQNQELSGARTNLYGAQAEKLAKVGEKAKSWDDLDPNARRDMMKNFSELKWGSSPETKAEIEALEKKYKTRAVAAYTNIVFFGADPNDPFGEGKASSDAKTPSATPVDELDKELGL